MLRTTAEGGIVMSSKNNPAEKDTSQYRAPLLDGVEDSQIFRRSVVAVSKNTADDRAVHLSVFNETVDMFKKPESGPVKGRAETLPPWLRITQLISTIGVVLGLVVMVMLMYGNTWWYGVAIAAVFLAIRIALAYVQHRITQAAWIRRMEAQKSK